MQSYQIRTGGDRGRDGPKSGSFGSPFVVVKSGEHVADIKAKITVHVSTPKTSPSGSFCDRYMSEPKQ